MTDPIELNRRNWDERAPLHAASTDYEVEKFVADPAHLSEVVRFDLPRLGDIQGLRAVHLQCHIGTDTLSLSRLGAEVSGLDFSSQSLAQARALAERCGARIDYVEADVYAADRVLAPNSFDLVYTGIGALIWLPSIERWARTVAALLKPGGRLFLREGHPMLLAVNEDYQDKLVIEYPYFEREAPTVWDSGETYVETDRLLEQTVTHEWNHGLGEIISALLKHGLQITALVEHDSIPWEALPGQMSTDAAGEWSLDKDRWRLPLSYTLQAVKQG
ncbi:Ubiquinone biosynthesis O-methyltransferase [compost metagenome]|uniref:Methyltransferase domain protein n=1 Tax=Pseudomonas wadenswilerensis TaxID=1785161 RepID=A0A380T1U3_9PSED|nr:MULTISPECIES: class I SAM-dependent methyltransferase [Pseudomonas]MCE5985348.1 class I SAM-dependent methyltransferase [Pseudomonas sp. LF19]UVM19879.1 class I SAM-dependent methyltransferase [Pseudomonas wadenswilerensis]SPO66192.1 Methyltransferase [Pseudomonas sp. JV241A]SUQ63498.1 Methyltransferase domain protein [Pseudomonas wadenswilerensis]